MAIVLQTSWRSLELGDRSKATALAVAGAAAGLIAPCVLTLWHFPYSTTYSSNRAFGDSFRSFNAFLDRLPGPVGFSFNDNISYFPLIAHCNFSQIMYHLGSTVGFADVRFSERIQADRYPNYRLVYFFRIISAKYHWGAAHLDAAVDQGIPALDVPTELVPISRAEVAKRCAALETRIPCLPVDAVPPGEETAGFMAKHPESGLRREDYGNMHWSILPITEPSVRDAMLNDVWPPRWSRQGRGYYLVVTPLGYYLMGLAVPGAPH